MNFSRRRFLAAAAGAGALSAARPTLGEQEYKKGIETYGQWFDPPLRIIDGALTVPKGPGVGIADPKEILKGAVQVAKD
jgi:L-alanine-DL-glutamate epimerase-like enolase superfamily enzyme